MVDARSAAIRLLGLCVGIPWGACMSVCSVMSYRGLCVGLITRQKKSSRVCVCVCVCVCGVCVCVCVCGRGGPC